MYSIFTPLPLSRRLLLSAALFLACQQALADKVLVFAAASLTDALAEVGQAYEQKSGDDIVFSFASSSTLARQIAQGAPADIFVSANLKWMDYLAKQQAILLESCSNLLSNSLALIAPANSAIKPFTLSADSQLSKLLGDGRLALGDPAAVPAGIYAKQALIKLQLWPSLAHKLAPSANVRAALALVAQGEAPLGVVYLTDAKASGKVRLVASFPASSHDPIVYPAALTQAAQGKPAASHFLRFMHSPAASAIFTKYGFSSLAATPAAAVSVAHK